MMFRVLALISFFWLAAPPVRAGALETLLAAETTEAGLSLKVRTGGCTKKEDFEITAKPSAAGAEITARRIKPDDCKGNFPGGTVLQFSWADLKLAPGTRLIVANLIESKAAPTPARKRAKSRRRKTRLARQTKHAWRAHRTRVESLRRPRARRVRHRCY